MGPRTGRRARASVSRLASIAALGWSLCACVEGPPGPNLSDGLSDGPSRDALEGPRSRALAPIDDAVERRVAARGEARVLVQLEVPQLPAASLRRFDAGDTGDAATWISAPIAATSDALLARLPPSTRLERRFTFIEALALTVDAEGLAQLAAAPEVRAVSLDPGGEAHMIEAGELGGFTQLAAEGHRGAGMRIAVIDSGVDREHPDFGDRIVDEACFCTGCCAGGTNTQFGEGSAVDDRGHGTNVAGIALGGGVVAPPGAAPEAELVAVKVLDEHGGFCCMSDVFAAIDWVLETHPEVAVINTSFGSFDLFEGHCTGTAWLDALEALVEFLRANDIVMVASSGNSARETMISAPACSAPTIAVAATWDADFGELATKECVDDDAYLDRIACFSNLSTALDMFAPGISIVAPARGGGTTKEYEGTSQAAPQVSACATLLRAARPEISTAELEAALLRSQVWIPIEHLELVLPRLQCDVALASLPPRPPSDADDGAEGSTDTGGDGDEGESGSGSGGGPALDDAAGCSCSTDTGEGPSRGAPAGLGLGLLLLAWWRAQSSRQ